MKVNNVLKKDWKFFSQRQRMSPFPNYMSMEAMCSELEKFVGIKLSCVLMIFEDRVFTAFLSEKDHREKGMILLNKLKKNPQLFSTLVKKENKFGKKLTDFCKASNKKNLKNQSNSFLLQVYKGFSSRYKEVYACYGSVWVVESFLHDKLFEIVHKRIEDTELAKEYLNTLTIQPRAMVAKIESDNLVELGKKIQSKSSWSNLLGKEKWDILPIELKKLISMHEKKFFWVTRDYEDLVIDKEKIIERVKVLLQKNLSKEKNTIDKNEIELKKKKAMITKKLSLKKEEKRLFKAMLDVSYLKELRKKYVSISLYYFDSVLSEIAQRGNLSLKQARVLAEKDIEDLLLKKKDFTNETNDRLRLSAWYMTGNGTFVYKKNDASKIKEKLMNSKQTDTFVGEPVSPGKARGPARIILHPEEIDKVQRGDVIVSIQIVPSFSSAMHKAVGLICDGGHGITAHPAIMAREAGIPAIIKTKNAHIVLKDGDMVEVDGYKGIAKKID